MGVEEKPPWLEEALAGVYVLHGVDEEAVQTLVRGVVAEYDGPDFGGLDLMAPNAAGDAYLILGRWTDAFDPDVRAAARAVLGLLEHAERIRSSGVDLSPDGGVTLTTAPRPAVTVEPWYAYNVRIVLPPMTVEDEEVALNEIFPRLPGWLGLHMGAPHWLGHGMSREGDRIVALTPYVRIDFEREARPGRTGIHIAGAAPRPAFSEWLSNLRGATGWF